MTNHQTYSWTAFLMALAGHASVQAQSLNLPTLHVFDGDNRYDNFGYSVSGAGDVNDDGYDDLIIGAPGHSSAAGSFAGQVKVISGLDGTTLYIYEGNPGSAFGSAVSGAGDVNFDGHADFIAASAGDDTNGIDAGIAIVYSGIDGSVLYTFLGKNPGDLFGFSVSSARVFGNPGLVIGAPGLDRPNGNQNEGAVFVYQGFDGSLYRTYQTGSLNTGLSFSVSGIKDANPFAPGDKIIAGADGFNFNGQRAVLYPPAGSLGQVPITFLNKDPLLRFGESVADAGDVNSDGIADFIIGAPNRISPFTQQSGKVRVFSGANNTVIHTFTDEPIGNEFGFSVSGIGDVNNDGYDDVVIGTPSHDPTAAFVGKISVFSGFDGAKLFEAEGDNFGDRLGFSVSNAGDVNGDGITDFIVGAVEGGANKGGYAIVYAGVNDPCTGAGPSCIGDLNGDGSVDDDDLAILMKNMGRQCHPPKP